MDNFIKIMVCAVLIFASAAARPAQAAASATPEISAMWPRTIAKDGASVTIYQPQAESWPRRQLLTARAAVEIKPKGQDQTLLGTIELSLATSTDAAAGIVSLSDPRLLSTHFPSLDTQQAAALEAKLRAALPGIDVRPVPLAAVLLSLNQTPAAPVAVKNDPPQIFYAAGPASMVVFDGPPVLAPAGKSGISYAVNTNWNVFAYQGNWYLLNNGQWFIAGATGAYAPVSRLPEAFKSLPKDSNFADARKAIPPHAPPAGYTAPTIFVSMQPAEIIITQGAPLFQPVSGTALQRVANTDSTLFFYPPQKQFFVLMSGRWFAAAALTGPWRYASDSLPADFSLIQPSSPEAAVLPSVPDTTQAQDAVLKAQIPVTATLKRTTAKINVVYAGAPRFVPIAGTPISRAANTSAVVLGIEGRFYACVNGAWFVAGAPTGPWVPADAIPRVIKTIPPSSVAYPVTYVDVYASTPATVTYGYTAGYVMSFVSAGVLVYGTGYYYPPYVIPGPVPIFFPYPYSYVGHVYYSAATGAWARGGTIYGQYGVATGARYYNPATGAWAHGGAVYGPYGGVGGFSAYNPSTGSYARGSASWSNGYGTGNASFYNAKTGRSGSTNQNWSPYGRSGSSTVSGPNQIVHTQSGRNANGAAGSFSSSTGTKGVGYHNSRTGSNGGAVKTVNGDVYAGRDGNVYKHTDDGWQKYDKGGWNQMQKPQNYNRQSGGGRSGYGGADRGNYQQLEQDRVGRQNGWGGGGGFRSGGGGRRYR